MANMCVANAHMFTRVELESQPLASLKLLGKVLVALKIWLQIKEDIFLISRFATTSGFAFFFHNMFRLNAP